MDGQHFIRITLNGNSCMKSDFYLAKKWHWIGFFHFVLLLFSAESVTSTKFESLFFFKIDWQKIWSVKRDTSSVEHAAVEEVKPLNGSLVASCLAADHQGHMSPMLPPGRSSPLSPHKNSCCTQRISEWWAVTWTTTRGSHHPLTHSQRSAHAAPPLPAQLPV